MGLGRIGHAAGGRQHIFKVLKSNIEHHGPDNTAGAARGNYRVAMLRRLCLPLCCIADEVRAGERPRCIGRWPRVGVAVGCLALTCRSGASPTRSERESERPRCIGRWPRLGVAVGCVSFTCRSGAPPTSAERESRLDALTDRLAWALPSDASPLPAGLVLRLRRPVGCVAFALHNAPLYIARMKIPL